MWASAPAHAQHRKPRHQRRHQQHRPLRQRRDALGRHVRECCRHALDRCHIRQGAGGAGAVTTETAEGVARVGSGRTGAAASGQYRVRRAAHRARPRRVDRRGDGVRACDVVEQRVCSACSVGRGDQHTGHTGRPARSGTGDGVRIDHCHASAGHTAHRDRSGPGKACARDGDERAPKVSARAGRDLRDGRCVAQICQRRDGWLVWLDGGGVGARVERVVTYSDALARLENDAAACAVGTCARAPSAAGATQCSDRGIGVDGSFGVDRHRSGCAARATQRPGLPDAASATAGQNLCARRTGKRAAGVERQRARRTTCAPCAARLATIAQAARAARATLYRCCRSGFDRDGAAYVEDAAGHSRRGCACTPRLACSASGTATAPVTGRPERARQNHVAKHLDANRHPKHQHHAWVDREVAPHRQRRAG